VETLLRVVYLRSFWTTKTRCTACCGKGDLPLAVVPISCPPPTRIKAGFPCSSKGHPHTISAVSMRAHTGQQLPRAGWLLALALTMTLLPVLMQVRVAAAADAGGAAPPSCPDKVLPGVGVGGPGYTALANVSDQGACCALCHDNYQDECAAWVFGFVPVADSAAGLPSHNCAIMPVLLPARNVSGVVSGIAGHKPPPTPPTPPGSLGNPCRADLDCRLGSAEHWRCVHDAKGTPSPASNCHLPGPGSKGNSTCACGQMECSPSPSPRNTTAFQYLMIGDRYVSIDLCTHGFVALLIVVFGSRFHSFWPTKSLVFWHRSPLSTAGPLYLSCASISLGMESDLNTLVAARGWELTHNPGNAASSNLGAHCVGTWLQTVRWIAGTCCHIGVGTALSIVCGVCGGFENMQTLF